MTRSALRIAAFALTLALAVGLGAAPAYALYDTTVPNHAYVGEQDLFGMTEQEARAAIAANAGVPALSLEVTCAAKPFSLDLQRAVSLDVDAMLASAYTTPAVQAAFAVSPSYVTSSTVVSAFVKQIASAVYLAPVTATYYVRYGRLRYRPGAYGRRLNTVTATAAITSALISEATSGTPSAITLGTARITPAVTGATVGKAILVDLSSRKLWLYNQTTVVCTYGVAVGMRSYPTPTGTFKVIAKKANPTWYNPGSSWAAGMPDVIGPSPYNPLGTRALYLNKPGIRIHGTYKTWTIGTAASHGCVRVANRNIERLYPLVPVGTKVFIVP